MLYLSYGMPKSASSFCYQLVLDALRKYAEKNNLTMCNIQDVFPGYKYSGFFDPSVDCSLDFFLERALTEIGQDKCIAVKVHCDISENAKKMIEEKLILANASFRHPADCILSYMDAHRKESIGNDEIRFKGGESYRASLTTIRNQGNIFLRWAALKRMIVISFDELATTPQVFVEKISRQIGIPVNAHEFLQSYLDDKEKIWEFNKGILNRRFVELSPPEIAEVEKECQTLLRFIETYKGALTHSDPAKG